jgi:carboxyl-terminal processing protease
MPFRRLAAASIMGILLVPAAISRAQHISGFDKTRAEDMLKEIQGDVRKNYYDPGLHGLDWDAEVRATKQKIEESPSLNMAMSHIAALLDKLNDSHTFFLLPPRPYKHQFGYSESIIGDRCFIARVRPGSDAEKKGLHIGDEVLAINGYVPTRANLWKMQYVFRGLRPQPNLTLDLKTPEGAGEKLIIDANILQIPISDNAVDHFYQQLRLLESNNANQPRPLVDLGAGVAIFRYSEFAENKAGVDKILKELKPYKAVILDLRGNGGGSVETLKWFLGAFFDRPITIADRVTRKPADRKPMITKPHESTYLTAKLVVLIDSRSASAAEIFAKTIQIQKRGTVVGDVSSGSVMEAVHKDYHSGPDVAAFYGASITEADVIMPDGKSLEHFGVTPDVLVLPTGAELAARRDPVIVRAAELCGIVITPEKAGTLYPDFWPKE